jgi:signal transduction histidine kinase/ActR/RegA family two-component response regulator
MTMGGDDLDRRVLFLAPTARDAETTNKLFTTAGVAIESCFTLTALLDALEEGAAATVIPEEALTTTLTARLCELLAEQPPWSDLPVLILTRAGADSKTIDMAVRTLGNVTLLERPVRFGTLVTAVRTALRARERQYQIRGYLKERTEAEAALRLADQRKDEFLATLGHELRNPLTPLLMGLQLLRTSGGADADGRVKAVMERQINHLVRLVDDLLEVSRITRGLIEIQREPMDLASAVRYAIDTSRTAVESAGHELIVRLPSQAITVAGDAVRLTQVFANLIANAAKYTNSGGTIWVTLSGEGNRAMVSVRDNGIGIPPAHLRSVFDMFTQVDRSGRRAQGGLGIGLTLVRSLVDMHGGRVEARSAGLGAGSEFIVDLPTALESILPADVSDPGPLPPRRILLVDDNPDALETLASLLAVLGASVATASSGREALGMLDRVQPDAVLLDIGMPEMDGHEVARRIRAIPQYAGALLIALTGWGQDQDFALSSAAGFDHHLVKPPDINRLRAILAQSPPGAPAVMAPMPDRRAVRHAIRSR